MEGRGLITVGHGTSGRAELAALLHGAGVAALVDVRTAPGSRRNPDVTRETLQCWLPATGIDYRWEKRLGGWRKVAADSPDIIWRNVSFRGYAGYMRDPGFVAAIDAVLTDTATHGPPSCAARPCGGVVIAASSPTSLSLVAGCRCST